MTYTDKFQLVGSLLRPKELLIYKNEIEHREDIQYPFYDQLSGYQETENTAIEAIITQQKAHELSIITDGEYGRSMWHLDFIWGFSGIRRFIADQGYLFQDLDGGHFETRKDIGIEILAPLSGKNHHYLTIYQKTKALAGDTPVKITVWGAAHAFTELAIFKGLYGENQVYPTKEALKEGLLKAYKEFIEEYRQIGGEIIQFDDCLWELFAEDNEKSFFTQGNNGLENLADEFISINNEIIDFAHQLGLKVWTHNCRGNYQSRHAAGGSYQSIAEKFLKDQHYDRFFLEWDDERAGDIEALAVLKDKPNIEIVLGLLSSKTNHLDDEKRVFDLLNKASNIIPKERLYLSHQCGFASCDCGNELSIEQQWEKIEQGKRIAHEFFGV